MKNILLTLAGLVFLTSCDRLKLDEKSQIQIQLPELSASAQLSSQKVSAFAGSTSRPVPTGFDGATPINCYLVAVGGPDLPLKRNKCGRENNSMVPVYVGPWVGGVSSGSTLNLDVEPGLDRVFYVVGFHAAAGFCKDFKGGFPNEISNPYIVGVADKVTLKPGELKDLPIPIAFDADKWFDGCQGPDFPEHGGDGGGGPATKAVLSKRFFPHNTFVADTCQWVDLRFENDAGGDGESPVAMDVQLKISGSPVSVFNSPSDCVGNINSLLTTNIPAGTRNVQFLFKAPATPAGSLNFAASIANAPAGFSTPIKQFANVASGSDTFRINGPDRLLANMCYPFDIERISVNENPPSDINNASYPVDFSASGLSVYSDSSCVTATSSSGFAANVSSLRVYVKLPAVAVLGSLGVSTSTGPPYAPAQLNFYQGGGSASPQYVEIHGDNMLGTGGGCYNHPYKVQVLNEYHVPIVLNTDFGFSVTSNNTLDVGFAVDNVCTSPQAALSTSVSAGEYMKYIYLQKSSGVSGNLDLKVNWANGLESIYPVFVQ